MQLGRKIRDLRLRRGLTVQRLAWAAGLSKGFISQLENGRTSPSLATLQRLARALEISVAYLVVEEEQAPFVMRAGERPQVPVGSNGSRAEMLSATPKRNLDLWIVELPPGGSGNRERSFHHGEEVLVCLEGTVALTYGDQRIVLEAGDSCHFDGRVPHAADNCGEETARVLIAMTPATFESPVPDAVAAGQAAGPQERRAP